VLHVLDASSDRADEEERVAVETFEELGVPPERILAVWNKADLSSIRGRFGGLAVSALTGAGSTSSRRRSSAGFPESGQFQVRIPYTSARAIAAARAAFRVVEEEDRGDSLWMLLAGDRRNLAPLERFRQT
jgi:50S ribosomal subunit-associated GTPase HflX